MLKVIRVCADCYFLYVIGKTLYDMGHAAGLEEASGTSQSSASYNASEYKVIDGVTYQRVVVN